MDNQFYSAATTLRAYNFAMLLADENCVWKASGVPFFHLYIVMAQKTYPFQRIRITSNTCLRQRRSYSSKDGSAPLFFLPHCSRVNPCTGYQTQGWRWRRRLVPNVRMTHLQKVKGVTCKCKKRVKGCKIDADSSQKAVPDCGHLYRLKNHRLAFKMYIFLLDLKSTGEEDIFMF